MKDFFKAAFAVKRGKPRRVVRTEKTEDGTIWSYDKDGNLIGWCGPRVLKAWLKGKENG